MLLSKIHITVPLATISTTEFDPELYLKPSIYEYIVICQWQTALACTLNSYMWMHVWMSGRHIVTSAFQVKNAIFDL